VLHDLESFIPDPAQSLTLKLSERLPQLLDCLLALLQACNLLANLIQKRQFFAHFAQSGVNVCVVRLLVNQLLKLFEKINFDEV
jgi:hypothetical protein